MNLFLFKHVNVLMLITASDLLTARKMLESKFPMWSGEGRITELNILHIPQILNIDQV